MTTLLTKYFNYYFSWIFLKKKPPMYKIIGKSKNLAVSAVWGKDGGTEGGGEGGREGGRKGGSLPLRCLRYDPSGSWQRLLAIRWEPWVNASSSMSSTTIESRACNQGWYKKHSITFCVTILHFFKNIITHKNSFQVFNHFKDIYFSIIFLYFINNNNRILKFQEHSVQIQERSRVLKWNHKIQEHSRSE